MNRNITKFFLLSIFFVFISKNTFSYWEWTPETGRWINPKYSVKDTPKEQFEWAESFRSQGDYEKAIREHKKLLKHYPNSEYAPESCYILGQIYQQSGDIEEAFDYYQKIIEDYPQFPKFSQVIKAQSEIAEKLLNKKSIKIVEFLKSDKDKTEKLERVIQNDPYSEETAERYLKLGIFYFNQRNYKKAEESFEKMINEFPNSKFAEKAEFYLIKTHYLSIPKVETNPLEYEKVKNEIDSFLKKYPDSEEKNNLLEIKNEIVDKEAKKLFEIASFYEKTGKKVSAEIYYRKIIKSFPETKYGEIAKQKISGN